MNSRLLLPILLVLAFMIPMGTVRADTTVLYVDQDADGDDDGSSWEDAFEDLQDALAEADDLNPDEDDPIEIWVAEGTYIPGDARSDSFELLAHVSLYGGFDGEESVRSSRDPQANPTILSGDVDGDDSQNPITDLSTVDNNTNNARHVLLAAGDSGLTALVDGFVITGGYANGSPPNNRGGALRVTAFGAVTLNNNEVTGNVGITVGAVIIEPGGEAVITDNIFTENRARDGGGGALGIVSDQPVRVTGNTFRDNVTNLTGGAIIALDVDESLTITQNTFRNNEVTADGGLGGALAFGDTLGFGPRITDNTFRDNSAGIGGALACENGRGIIVNNTFEDNSAGNDAGAVELDNCDDTELMTNTFTTNSATDQGGAIRSTGDDVRIEGNTFTENSLSAAGSQGGALHTRDNPAIGENTFTGNTAASGGAIFVEAGSPIIGLNFFHANRANGNGGAILDESSAGSRIYSNVLVGNVAERGAGIYLADSGSAPEVINNTLVENTASDLGGGLINDDTDVLVANNIIWDNFATNGATQIGESGVGDPTYRNNIVQGGAQGSTDADPEFIRDPSPGDADWTTLGDNDYGDLRIEIGSPALHAGGTSLLPLTPRSIGRIIPVDVGGFDRVYGPAIDVGAYEFQPGVLVSEETIQLTEGDEEETYTVSLYGVVSATQSVDVTVTALDGVQISTDDGSTYVQEVVLSFDTTTWDDPQTITLRARDGGGGYLSIVHHVTDGPMAYRDLLPRQVPVRVLYNTDTYLVNPSFEDTFDDLWDWDTRLSIENEDSLDGRVVDQAAVDGDAVFALEGDGAYEFVRQRSLTIPDGDSGDEITLRYRAAVREVPESGDLGVRLVLYNGDEATGDVILCLDDIARGSLRWRTLTCTIEATTGYDNVEVGLGWRNVPSGLVAFDDLTIIVTD